MAILLANVKLKGIKMKAELFNHPNKGLCILISELNNTDLLCHMVGDKVNIPERYTYFSNIHAIADELKAGRFISAIKEVRNQTYWGLKEAKDYLEKYRNYGKGFIDYGERFIRDHTLPPNLLDNDDFKLE